MDLEDLFDNRRKNHGSYRQEHGYHDEDKHRYHDEDRYSRHSDKSDHGKIDHQKWLDILGKIKSNKKLKLLLILGCILLLTVIIGLIIVLWPIVIKLVNYISQNGLQGIVDGISGFIDSILKGTGK